MILLRSVLFMELLLSIVGGQQEEDSLAYKYAVVVDCGSSGSRAHIYSWPRDTSSAELPIKIDHLKGANGKELILRIEPGISSFRENPEQASDYMRPVMEFASRNVPQELHSETPVYFMGTAGLRLLTKEEQDRILEDLRDDLRAEFDFPLLFSEVISGSREGQYQWLSVNSEANRLTPFYDINSATGNDKFLLLSRPNTRRRFGVLELGGASGQVAFELSRPIEKIITFKLHHSPEALEAFRSSILETKIGEDRITKVFSTTFLGFGTNSARELSIDLLVREAFRLSGYTSKTGEPLSTRDGTITLKDPCLPVGAEQTFEKPIDLLTNPSRNLGYALTGAEVPGSTLEVKLLGQGSYKKCRMLLERMLKLVKEEQTNCAEKELSCSTSLLGSSFIPGKLFQFLGLAEFLYTTREMIHEEGPFNSGSITTKTTQICATPFEELLKKYPEANKIDKNRVLLQCFKATWMLTFLQLGLKAPSSFGPDFQTVGNQYDWTLGALIDKLHNSQ